MSARDDLYLFAMVGKVHEDGNRAMAQRKLDAHRAEVLAEAKVETVDWLVKKAREYYSTGSKQHALQADVIGTLASKLDRGAVRAFLGTAHYRDAMDAHRAEVLAADGQAYDGELAMLRSLVRTLRVVVRPDDANVAEVRSLLHQHADDERDARQGGASRG
ncbi:hypothetical protein [Streptomyces sp. STCH 565 A]|uniref:hypothetical protein n=1 Tax=Streptomyces sp. STCH 565 A TaxID=2950532 RepID=UPI00207505E8|nr:hypothetical protein [Streptomyces sp. STCH 565 A]MCM8552661.1 hypothetical protein [Streptomyces sp. STCH 565 A]